MAKINPLSGPVGRGAARLVGIDIMKSSDLTEAIAGDMTEKELRDNYVISAAKVLGWTVYFTYDSRHSPYGLVDLIMIRDKKILWRELKSEVGVLTEGQRSCIAILKFAGEDVTVWRPSDWMSGKIEEELR